MCILSISENILLIFSGFGMLQGFFCATLLYFHPKSDRSVNRFLAFYVLALTLPIIIPLAQYVFSWQAGLFIEPFLTLIGPLMYLYICSFKEVINWKKAWPHFLFFLLCIPLALWVYFSVGRRYPSSERIPTEATKQVLLMIPISVRLVQRIIYYFLARRALAFYQRSIVHLFSDTSRINLNWINWLINGFLFLILWTFLVYYLMIRFPEQFSLWVLLSGVIVSLYIYMVVFRGITQTSLWQVHPGITKEKLQKDINAAGQLESVDPPEEKSQPSHTRINEIASRILAVMENEKLFQEPELTLQNLADKLQSPSYQVSRAINEGIKKSFYDLVNGYRVEEAKRLLLAPKSRNYTILSVGYEAGFNSKTTFNTVFKKSTGLTPTDFRERQKRAVQGSDLVK